MTTKQMLLLALLRRLVDEIGERIMQEAGHKLVKATFFLLQQ
jgi:hypothetical protein